MTALDTIARWRAAGEAGDADAAVATMSSEVELISPLTDRFRFHGREQLRDLLTAAFTTIADIRYHTELGDEQTRSLFYYGRIGDDDFEEAQLIRLDDAGLIRQITLFGRPLPAVTGLMRALGPKLATQQGRRGAAAIIRVSAAPLDGMTHTGDRNVVPLADPNRA
jgi:hypothetical protein